MDGRFSLQAPDQVQAPIIIQGVLTDTAVVVLKQGGRVIAAVTVGDEGPERTVFSGMPMERLEALLEAIGFLRGVPVESNQDAQTAYAGQSGDTQAPGGELGESGGF